MSCSLILDILRISKLSHQVVIFIILLNVAARKFKLIYVACFVADVVFLWDDTAGAMDLVPACTSLPTGLPTDPGH